MSMNIGDNDNNFATPKTNPAGPTGATVTSHGTSEVQTPAAQPVRDPTSIGVNDGKVAPVDPFPGYRAWATSDDRYEVMYPNGGVWFNDYRGLWEKVTGGPLAHHLELTGPAREAAIRKLLEWHGKQDSRDSQPTLEVASTEGTTGVPAPAAQAPASELEEVAKVFDSLAGMIRGGYGSVTAGECERYAAAIRRHIGEVEGMKAEADKLNRDIITLAKQRNCALDDVIRLEAERDALKSELAAVRTQLENQAKSMAVYQEKYDKLEAAARTLAEAAWDLKTMGWTPWCTKHKVNPLDGCAHHMNYLAAPVLALLNPRTADTVKSELQAACITLGDNPTDTNWAKVVALREELKGMVNP